MSKRRWLTKARLPNKKMIREAKLWAEPHEVANQRTLNQIAATATYRSLISDIARLEKLEIIFNKVELGEAPKIPCPICNSKDFLVESWSHRKILVCERPTCTYIRARMKRDEMIRSEMRILKVVNQ